MDTADGKTSEEKPQRLYFETYLRLVKNSVGTNMFRNFFVRTGVQGEFDALENGENSCAFFVSSVLVLFKKLGGVHGTVSGTVKDMRISGWQQVSDLKPGDVIVWQAQEFPDGNYNHIGFYIGGKRAVSTSSIKRTVAEHDVNFGKLGRPIEQIFRMGSWD